MLAELAQDPEFEKTQNVLENLWDDDSVATLIEKPEMLRGLHVDVKTGMFDKVASVATSMKTKDILMYGKPTGSDLDYYIKAGAQVLSEAEQNAQQAKQTSENTKPKKKLVRTAEKAVKKSKDLQSTKKVKKSAAIPKKTTQKTSVVNYIDDISDEDFEEWYQKLQERY